MQSDSQTLEPTQSSPPRRALWRRILLPRFSLRTLLVLLTLFSFAAAWVGNWVYRSKTQRRTVQALWNTNCARLHYEAFHPGETPRKRDDQKWIPDFAFNGLGPDYFQNIRAIEIVSGFAYSSLNPKVEYPTQAVELLLQLNQLEDVDVRYSGAKNPYNNWICNVDSKKLFQTMGQLPDLITLRLTIPAQEANYRAEHILELKRCKKLRQLGLKVNSYPGIADISAVCELVDLEDLWIDEADESTLWRLGKLTKLKCLHLNTKRHNTKQLQELATLKEITELSLEQSEPTSLEYYAILAKQFPKLKELRLHWEDNPYVLAPLKDHPSLKKLYLYYDNRMTGDKYEIACNLLKGMEIDLFIE